MIPENYLSKSTNMAVTGYQINTQKSLTFLFTNSERSGREIKETIPFSIALKRIKYSRTILSKEAKDLYAV